MIYVHVPFCLSFCRYCDFYSERCRGGQAEEFDAYIDDLCAEARLRRGEILETIQGANTLYIGGGTPSVMPHRFFTELLKALPEGPFEEFTVEVNPEDVVRRGVGYLRTLRGFGVNRISMGVQSFDDSVLRWMGRRHNARRAAEAFRLIRDAGFDNVSLDIIFGIGSWSGGPASNARGSFTREMLSDTIDHILALSPEHISAYQLSIEEGSQLAKDASEGKYVEASDDECAGQYSLICERLREAGYRHYEISNWARPGREAVHNSAYWARVPYVGLGPGAHSPENHGRQRRSWNSESLSGWTSEGEILTPEEIREETIMLGTRRTGGVDYAGKHYAIPEDRWFVADSLVADMVAGESFGQ